MEKTIPGKEKCFDNTGLGCGGTGKSAFCHAGDTGWFAVQLTAVENYYVSVSAANREKLQDRNDSTWHCQGERLTE